MDRRECHEAGRICGHAAIGHLPEIAPRDGILRPGFPRQVRPESMARD